jgi:hypothetical protein
MTEATPDVPPEILASHVAEHIRRLIRISGEQFAATWERRQSDNDLIYYVDSTIECYRDRLDSRFGPDHVEDVIRIAEQFEGRPLLTFPAPRESIDEMLRSPDRSRQRIGAELKSIPPGPDRMGKLVVPVFVEFLQGLGSGSWTPSPDLGEQIEYDICADVLAN